MYFIQYGTKHMKISILLDKNNYTTKPNTKDNSKITKGLNTNPITIELSELVNYIETGHTFTLSAFKDTRHNSNWLSQQVFGLDFDEEITVEEVKNRLANFDLDCNIIYPTFTSDSTNNKFRVLIAVSELITSINIRNELQLCLMKLFPEADKACKDAGRMFFGTNKKAIYLNIDYCARPENIVSSSLLYQMSISSNPDRTLKNCQKSSTHYINPNNAYSEIDTFEYDSIMTNEFDWKIASSRIKILNDLIGGKWLYHNELFGLATNMYYLKGGQKLFKESLDKCDKYTKDKYLIMNYIKKVAYKPMRLENYSPYKEDSYYKNIYRSVILEDNKPIKVEEDILIKLEEAETIFNNLWQQTLNNSEVDITVFKLPTGFGKTESYLNLTNATIAIPTNSLKYEVSNRFKVNHSVTPEIPEDLNPDIQLRIKHLYNTGNYNAVKSYLKELETTYPQIKEYKTKLNNCLLSKNTVLTTTEKALVIDFNNDLVIFDEDPLENLLKIESLDKGDVENLLHEKIHKSDKVVLESLLNYLNNTLANSVIETPKLQFRNLKLIQDILFTKDKKYNSNLLEFFKSNCFIKDSDNVTKFHYLLKRKLPNKKIVIFSATASEFIYKTLYPECKFIDITNIELKGNIIQDTEYSFSRTSLYQNIEKALHKIQPYPVLTFKNLLHYFPNAIQTIYFGNCLGYDSLKGLDINIVGTPHNNPLVYSLYSKALNIEYDTEDFITYKQQVKRNGYLFNFKTYYNKGLQELQFYFIEKDLVQLIGRARLLRYDSNVYVYSNYPLKQATLV